MSYELLLTFISLAKLKNFTKTAEQLHVVQSTITSRIRHLEDQLGEPLFVRSNKQVALTKAGEVFLPYAKQLLRTQEYAISRLKSIDVFTDNIAIGAVHSLYEGHVESMILKYMERYKKIALKVTIEHSEELIQMLHEGQLDLAFTYLPTKSQQFVCRPFHEDQIILVTGAHHQPSIRSVRDEELIKLPILSSAILTESFQEWFYALFPRNYLYPLDINISSSMVAFLKAGLGYSFMRASTAKPFIKEGSMIEIKLLESSPPSMQSYVLMRKQRLQSEGLMHWMDDFMSVSSSLE